MRDQLRGRYAIDPDSLGADPGAVQDALERRERALRLSAQTREQARLDEAVAAPLLVSAAGADRDQEREQNERDRDPANELEGVVDDETIEARVVADSSQARPAQDAVASSPTRTPTMRRARGKGSQVRSPARRPAAQPVEQIDLASRVIAGAFADAADRAPCDTISSATALCEVLTASHAV